MARLQKQSVIKYPANKKRLLFDWLICIALLVGSILAYNFLPVFSGILLLAGAIGTVYCPIIFFHNNSGLYILDEGINITTPLLKNSLVKWNQISHFSLYKLNDNVMIAAHLLNADSYMKEYSMWGKVFGNMSNHGSDKYYYHIDPATYGCNAEELGNLLEKKHKNHKIDGTKNHYTL